MEDFEKKYLKYKYKYLSLKNQLGGDTKELIFQVRIIKAERGKRPQWNWNKDPVLDKNGRVKYIPAEIKLTYERPNEKQDEYIEWEDNGYNTDHLLVISTNISPKDLNENEKELYDAYIAGLMSKLNQFTTKGKSKSYIIGTSFSKQYVSLISLKVDYEKCAISLGKGGTVQAQWTGSWGESELKNKLKTEDEVPMFEECIEIISSILSGPNYYLKGWMKRYMYDIKTRLVKEELLKKNDFENSNSGRGRDPIIIYNDEFNKFEKSASDTESY
jgi:hypothetical protein